MKEERLMDDKQRGAAATGARETVRKTSGNRIIDMIEPFEVEVPEGWGRIARPGTPCHGTCFEKSLLFALDIAAHLGPLDDARKETWLVHGEYANWNRHAWVELPGGIVFDGVAQRFYDRKGYYDAVRARPWYMYTLDAARIISARLPEGPEGLAHLGDWHVRLKMPWSYPANPTRIDAAEAERLLREAGIWHQNAPRPR
jgi:hypothetical protein